MDKSSIISSSSSACRRRISTYFKISHPAIASSCHVSHSHNAINWHSSPIKKYPLASDPMLKFLNHLPTSYVDGLRAIQNDKTNGVVLTDPSIPIDIVVPIFTGKKVLPVNLSIRCIQKSKRTYVQNFSLKNDLRRI